jgi:PKD repeat protein
MKLPLVRRWRRISRGQAMVEFALILPILVLLMVMSLDFGRVFFGWVGLQNVARVAADFAAAHPDAFDPNVPNSVIKQQLVNQYAAVVAREAAGLNCSPLPVATPTPSNIPQPSLDDANGNTRYDLGEKVTVKLSCSFGLITPLAESILGGDVDVVADAVFAVRGGTIAGTVVSSTAPTPSPSASPSATASPTPTSSSSSTPTPAPTPCQLPIANFSANPTHGHKPLTVQFNDTSQTFGCAVTGWQWNFGDGTAIATTRNASHKYTANGLYSVTLTVTSPGGTTSVFQPGYIHVCPQC